MPFPPGFVLDIQSLATRSTLGDVFSALLGSPPSGIERRSSDFPNRPSMSLVSGANYARTIQSLTARSTCTSPHRKCDRNNARFRRKIGRVVVYARDGSVLWVYLSGLSQGWQDLCGGTRPPTVEVGCAP